MEKPAKEFEGRLIVIRVRKVYAGPYQKHRYFYLERADLKSKKAFIQHIQKVAKYWEDGIYYLKLSSGRIFARFDLKSGKVKKLYETSPITGESYVCWAFFKK